MHNGEVGWGRRRGGEGGACNRTDVAVSSQGCSGRARGEELK